MHGLNTAGLEQPRRQFRCGVVGDDVIAHLVPHVAHAREASVEFEPHDARAGRRRPMRVTTSHNGTQASESALRPTWLR